MIKQKNDVKNDAVRKREMLRGARFRDGCIMFKCRSDFVLFLTFVEIMEVNKRLLQWSKLGRLFCSRYVNCDKG